MKRPIAMRMTPEQFESIKDRIKLPTFSLEQLDVFPVFVNYTSGRYSISNVSENLAKELEAGKEYHEKFNADIFLEACGVEVEKVWKSEEMQTLSSDGIWIDCIGGRKYRLKPQPDYSKEIEALQPKAKENGMSVIIKFEKL